MRREFGGISTYVEDVDFNKHFEEYYDSGEIAVYFSKKTFRHEEEGYLDFSYKYAILVTDIGDYTGDAPIVVELMLVPSFHDLTEENKERLRESGGYDEDDISEEWLWMDVLDYSFAVSMGEESINTPTDDIRDEWIESEPLKALIESAVAVYESVDRMKGFYLDRAWNMIGTTGWDTLNHAINGEDLFKF